MGSVENEEKLDRYEENLKLEEEKKASQDAVDNILKFYRKNKKICEDAYKYYKEFDEGVNRFVSVPTKITKSLFCKELKEQKILIITANPVEQAIFLRWLHHEAEKEYGTGVVLKSFLVGKIALVICNLNNKSIIHIHTKDTGEEYTRVAINNVTKIFSPSHIIMLGICYGLEMQKYKIGSVFVSDSITTFRLNFRDDEDSDETIYQAQDEYDEAPDEEFVETIRSKLSLTQIQSILSVVTSPTIASTTMGRFLSSNSLMSSKRVKDAVMDTYAKRKPKPLGGEMEGAGILKSNLVQDKKFQKWMIIKSICDWGEKKNKLAENEEENEKIKDSIQAFAMTNTVGTFAAILNNL